MGDSQGRVDTDRQSPLHCLLLPEIELNLGALGVLGGLENVVRLLWNALGWNTEMLSVTV